MRTIIQAFSLRCIRAQMQVSTRIGVMSVLVLASFAFVSPCLGEPAPQIEKAVATTRGSEEGDGSESTRNSSEQDLGNEELPALTNTDTRVLEVPRIPPPSTEKIVRIEGSIDTAFIVGTEFDDTKANSVYSRYTFDIGAPLSRVAAVGGRVRFGIRDFDFDGDGQFIDAGKSSGRPFDPLFEYSATVGGRFRLSDALELEVAGRVISRIEEGASFASGLEGGGSVSFRGRYRDWVVLRLGIALRSKFDSSSVHVSPVFRLRVRLHERLWAETGGRTGRLEFTATDRIRIDLFGGIESERYRLEDRRDGPNGVGEGSVSLQQTGVGLATRIRVWQSFHIRLEAGVVLIQNIEIKDEDGNSFDERENRDPAFQGRIALKWRF